MNTHYYKMIITNYCTFHKAHLKSFNFLKNWQCALWSKKYGNYVAFEGKTNVYPTELRFANVKRTDYSCKQHIALILITRHCWDYDWQLSPPKSLKLELPLIIITGQSGQWERVLSFYTYFYNLNARADRLI